MGCCAGSDGWAPASQVNIKQLQGMQSSESVKISARQFVHKLDEPIEQHYRFIKQLGAGSFGKVYEAEHIATSQRRAVKEIIKSPGSHEQQSQFLSEVSILSTLDHPNIVRVYELFETAEKYYIAMELVVGGELFDFLSQNRQLSEPVAARIMAQVLGAVWYCHQHKIVHRDLKPENLLLEKMPNSHVDIAIKIIDFGTSCLMSPDNKLQQRIGTAYYIAPEVLGMEYTEKCDIWSCGVMLFVLLCGYPPFNGRTNMEVMSKVRLGQFAFEGESWAPISDEAKSLIRRMLTKNYENRPTAEDCLKDPWLKKHQTAVSLSSVAVMKSLNNLRTFYIDNKLRRTVIAFIAARLLSSEATSELAAAFKALDVNHDGRLSREEMLTGYASIMPEEEAREVVEQVLLAADMDGSGFIDFTEFVAGSMSPKVLLSKRRLEQAFKSLDTDGSGAITLAELRSGLGLEHNPELWEKLASEVDQNGDGEIDLQEFTKMMMKASGN